MFFTFCEFLQQTYDQVIPPTDLEQHTRCRMVLSNESGCACATYVFLSLVPTSCRARERSFLFRSSHLLSTSWRRCPESHAGMLRSSTSDDAFCRSGGFTCGFRNICSILRPFQTECCHPEGRNLAPSVLGSASAKILTLWSHSADGTEGPATPRTVRAACHQIAGFKTS